MLEMITLENFACYSTAHVVYIESSLREPLIQDIAMFYRGK